MYYVRKHEASMPLRNGRQSSSSGNPVANQKYGTEQETSTPSRHAWEELGFVVPPGGSVEQDLGLKSSVHPKTDGFESKACWSRTQMLRDLISPGPF